MIRPRLQLDGVDQVNRALKDLTPNLRKAVNREVVRSILKIQAGAKRRVRVDRGFLRNTIAVGDNEALVQALSTNAGNDAAGIRLSSETTEAVAGTYSSYGPPVEFGSRPHFPPVAAIREWAKRKGIPEEAAFPIARAIAERGTPPSPFLFPSYEEEVPEFAQRLAAALKAELA